MSLQSKEKNIDAHLVKVIEFAARRKLLLQIKLVKLLGPALGAAAGAAKGSGVLDAKLGPEVIGPAVQKLADALDPQAFLQLVHELLQDTWIDGKDVKTDEAFDANFGNLAFMYKVLGFVLEVNFADFFGAGGIGSILQRFAPPLPPSPSPSA